MIPLNFRVINQDGIILCTIKVAPMSDSDYNFITEIPTSIFRGVYSNEEQRYTLYRLRNCKEPKVSYFVKSNVQTPYKVSVEVKHTEITEFEWFQIYCALSHNDKSADYVYNLDKYYTYSEFESRNINNSIINPILKCLFI